MTEVERTYTLSELKRAVRRAWMNKSAWASGLQQFEDTVVEALENTHGISIPEGVVCWGYNYIHEDWEPCVSTGNGWGRSGDKEYNIVRLTRYKDWHNAPMWARSRMVDKIGNAIWTDAKAEQVMRVEGCYAEEMPSKEWK